MAKSHEAPLSTKAESNGRKLPGRVVLLALVAFVVIFLDFESTSLSIYGTKRVDGNQVAVGALDAEAQELGRMQRYQLEQQWGDYTRRAANFTQSTGPETIVIDEEPVGNSTGVSASFSNASITGSIVPLVFPNASIEEIVVIEDWSVTQNDQVNITATQSSNFTIKRETVGEDIVVASSDQCFRHNTKAWLHGLRVGNADFNLTDDFVYKQILNPTNLLAPEMFAHLSSQTICHAESTFRHFSNKDWDVRNEKLVEEWTFRLIYMAIHHHQHEPATLEAQARLACPHDERNMSKFDYECPSSKFLVTNIADGGFGASFRLGAVGALLMGIATNRVTVFVNNFSGGAPFLKKPTLLASCPRRDMQCFFLPVTPCSVLAEDLRNATVMPEVDARDLRRQGILNKPEYLDAKVLVVEPRLNPPKKWSIQIKIQDRLHDIAVQLIGSIRQSATPAQIEVLEAAAARIKVDKGLGNDLSLENSTEYTYSNRHSKSAHAALLYLMRPNVNYQQYSDDIVSSIIPANLDRSLSIGLPIRASDKCDAESICYGFDTYMTLMHRMWDDQLQPPPGTKKGDIFLTTEDKIVMTSRLDYERNESFPFRFIVNKNDVLQGSGEPTSFKGRADSIMLASIVSMKLQLQSKFLVVNCCSNFHLIMFDLFLEGCGAVPDSQPMCLQEHPDPQFHICCGWTRSSECDDIRSRRKEVKQENEAIGPNRTLV